MKQDLAARLALKGFPFLTVAVIFVGDVVTPTEISMAPLAAVPVAVVAWFGGAALPLILGFAVTLDGLEVITGATSFQSAAAAAVACVSLAVVTRLAARGRTARAQVDAPGTTRFLRPAAIPPAPSPPAHKPLTRREREVVELAADGLTAREIGAQLFIGERTVETHLANSYAKLGITSKRALILERARTNSA